MGPVPEARTRGALPAVLQRQVGWLVPAFIVIICLWPAAVASFRATFAAFGRDQGIFQYVAWALSHGARDYVDVREINGPFIHIVHLLFMKLGGGDERVFRSIDMIMTGIVYFTIGAVLPGIGRSRSDPAIRVRWPARVLWGLAAWVVLTAHYMLYSWWDQAQRESFYNLFLIASVGLQLLAHTPNTLSSRTRRVILAFAGAASVATWFGKPTCVLYTVAQVAVVFLDKDAPLPKRDAVKALVLGCVLGAVPFIAFVAIYGDLAMCARIILLEAPRMYRLIWAKSIVGCYWAYGNAPKVNYGLATAAVGGVLLARGILPRRFLAIYALLVCGIITYFAQGKGFPYHLHPVSGGAHMLWIAGLVLMTERATRTGRWTMIASVLIGAAALAYQSRAEIVLSSTMTEPWYPIATSAEGRESAHFFDTFNRGDFFAWDLRQAAAFLKKTTAPTDRVQTYGMDPYLLFLAERRSATPFMYSFELNVDAALEGAGSDEKNREWLRSFARGNEDKLFAALTSSPPAAFALIDKAPFTFPQDADVDFSEHCPKTAAWMQEHYRPAQTFGVVRVWLRNDLWSRHH